MMDVNFRTLMKVEIDDAAIVDDIFSMRMSEKVQPHKEFIEAHAREILHKEIHV